MGRMAKIIAKSLAVGLACCLAFSLSEEKADANVWYKISTDELNPGKLIAVDMANGYSFADKGVIYIIAVDRGSREQIVIAFPDGGYWTAPSADAFLMGMQKEFNNLEEYLKSKKSFSLEKQ
mgnify:FL=1